MPDRNQKFKIEPKTPPFEKIAKIGIFPIFKILSGIQEQKKIKTFLQKWAKILKLIVQFFEFIPPQKCRI